MKKTSVKLKGHREMALISHSSLDFLDLNKFLIAYFNYCCIIELSILATQASSFTIK